MQVREPERHTNRAATLSGFFHTTYHTKEEKMTDMHIKT